MFINQKKQITNHCTGFLLHWRSVKTCEFKRWVAKGEHQIDTLIGGGKVKKHTGVVNQHLIPTLFLLMMLLAGCTQTSGPCAMEPYADLSEIDRFVGDDQIPFQFPLEKAFSATSLSRTEFCTSSSGPETKRKYHAAEDYFQPAGTPVYAIADGEISFSGRMGGYGWLIIINHPQANLFSLYGHLSPSRWYVESGTVSKGELIAYLGDADENGGSSKQPLEPHLHLGMRSGQRQDYPGRGEWRWQAGWIKPCPKNLGWLTPSEVIANQVNPIGGFSEPSSGFIAKWGIEFLFAGIYLFGAICMFVFATKRNQPLVIAISGSFLLVAGWVFYNKGWLISNLLIVVGIILLVIGLYRIIRNKIAAQP